MLEIDRSPRPPRWPAAARPLYPNCGRTMHLARIVAGAEGLPDLRTCSCGECGVSLTEAVAPDNVGEPGIGG
jgi:hypothetical protein